MPDATRRRLAVGGFFACYLVVGLYIVGDYGLSWDEGDSRHMGLVTARYLAGDPGLLDYEWRQYGVGFELPMYGIEQLLGLEDTREVFLARHVVTFLLFAAGAFVFFRLVESRFGSWKYGMLGVALLIASPRIFAHAFYNPKDLPFLSLFVMSMATAIRFVESPTVRRALLHALVTALAMNIRIVGLLIPALTLGSLAIEAFSRRVSIRRASLGSTVFLVALCVLVIAFWPFLWGDPIGRFAEAFELMRSFPARGAILFFGDNINTADLPWYYIPGWVAVTTPPLQLAAFVVGVVATIVALRTVEARERRIDVLVLAWLALPILAVVVLDATVYGGWRHLFFIYPAFVMLAMRGLDTAWGSHKGSRTGSPSAVRRGVVAVCVAAGLVSTVTFLVTSHPHQNVYFNSLAGHDVKHRFALDMWGLSYRQGLEAILAGDDREKVVVSVASEPGVLNAYILPLADRARLRYINDPTRADYFIGDFRGHPESYAPDDPAAEFHSIVVDGVQILVVYRFDR